MIGITFTFEGIPEGKIRESNSLSCKGYYMVYKFVLTEVSGYEISALVFYSNLFSPRSLTNNR